MTRPFNVLDPAEDIHQSYLLEASAGTGKTFAIENIVVRKLLEGDSPLKLEEMVIVTYTNAAVSDLKRRIYRNIREAYDRLHDSRLEDALQTFHDASIFTIHGFCLRMLQESGLEGGFCVGSVGNLQKSVLKRLVTDFLQVTFNTGCYTVRQIEILKGGKTIEDLIVKLIKWIQKGLPAEELPPLTEQKARLNELWTNLGEVPADEIRKWTPHYNKLKHAEQWLSPLENTQDFDLFFDLASNVLKHMTVENQTKPIKAIVVLPNNLQLFQKETLRFCSQSHLFSDLTEKCRQHVEHYCVKEDLTPFDLLLNQMSAACRKDSFVQGIRKKYKLAVVDEFQDTDPLQWHIFRSLFVGESQLILVGDPKQSIYGFRQADIYTYQSAAQSLGERALRTLDTNFRSTPQLVDALNTFFNADYTPGWIPLPRDRTDMPYRSVKAGKPESAAESGLVVQLAESNEDLLVGIANTIIEKQIPLNSTAILVKSHSEAEDVAKILQRAHIPFVMQKQKLLTQSDAWKDWITILSAIDTPKNRSAIKQALGTTLIGFTHLELRELDAQERLPYFMEQFVILKKCWSEQGLAQTIGKMNSKGFFYNESLRERLLKHELGELYLNQIEQIQDIALEEESSSRLGPQELILRAKELQELSCEEDTRLQTLQDHVREGVRILTIHTSKGLEFETVFALGVSNPKKIREELIPSSNPHRILVPFQSKEDPRVESYEEECDAEKMRQFYVALTRAKKWLYVPFIPNKKEKINFGESSSAQLFFARMGQPKQTDLRNLYTRIQELTCEEIKKIIPKHPGITLEQIGPAPVQKLPPKNSQKKLTPPVIPKIPGTPCFIESFTSLSQSHTAKRVERPIDSPVDPIPAGAATGILLHTIFEKIHFAHPESTPFLKGTTLEPWTAEIESLVQNATTHRFPENFTLAEIPPAHQFREMEFLYPHTSGYIKGVIDLVFCYDNKIHVIDWKSNLLINYTQDSLQDAMTQHDYFLQARLYKEAVKRFFGDLPVIIDYFFVRGTASFRVEDANVD